MITCGTQIVSGSTGGGGASAPAGTGVVTVSGGAFVDPVASAATTRATLDAMQDVFTTRGDLVRAGVGGVAERLALGANGYVLTSNGTDAAWAAAGGGGGGDATSIQGVAVNATAPTSGQALVYDGSEYVPTTVGGGGGSGVPARLITGFTDANHFTRAATVAADAVGGAGYSWLVCGYLSTSTAALRKAWEYVGTSVGWGFIVDGVTVKMYLAGVNGGAGASTPFSVGLTLTAGAAFAIVIEYVTGELRATLNGGTVVVTSLTGSFAPATAASAMGLGGDRVNAATYAFAEGKLAECDMISGALGDSAIQAFALAASTTYSFAAQLSAAQRAALKFSWLASDGGAPVRVGYGPLATAGTLLASQPV